MNRPGTLTLVVAVLAASTACNREKRISQVSPAAASAVAQTRESDLQPGSPSPSADAQNPYEGNYHAMNEGKRLYSWFNCSGCHSPGGGGSIGPPLIDAGWIYGNKPANIYETIVKGRPNGMPSFGGKIPQYQIWQLVTYVRSMSPEASKQPDKQQQ
jgi:cytochrome c oxidase cbb3-type subunit 3